MADEKSGLTLGKILGFLFLAAIIYVVVTQLMKDTDPLKGTAPTYLADLSKAKGSSNGIALKLSKHRVDGSSEYEKVRVQGNSCITYFTGALDSESFDKTEADKRMKDLNTALDAFDTWAGKHLPNDQQTSMTVDVAKTAKEYLDALHGREAERRKQVRKDFVDLIFPSWDEIISGKPTGDLPPASGDLPRL